MHNTYMFVDSHCVQLLTPVVMLINWYSIVLAVTAENFIWSPLPTLSNPTNTEGPISEGPHPA